MNNTECNWVLENLSAFIDNELDFSSSQEIKKHICSCLICRRAFSRMLKTVYAIKNYFAEEISPQKGVDYQAILASMQDFSIRK